MKTFQGQRAENEEYWNKNEMNTNDTACYKGLVDRLDTAFISPYSILDFRLKLKHCPLINLQQTLNDSNGSPYSF